MNLAIVSTQKRWDSAGRAWAAYHRSLGFAKMYVFVDAMLPNRIDGSGKPPYVELIECDGDYWNTLIAVDEYSSHIAAVRTALHTPEWGSPDALSNRQVLNVRSGLDRARSDGIDWLLHIDDDEYFWCPDMSAREHFEGLVRNGIEHAHYWNHEAIVLKGAPRSSDSTVFFKKNWEALSEAQRSAIPTLSEGKPYFLSYSNGKSAARVGPATEPHGAHYFKSTEFTSSNFVSLSRPGILHLPYRSADQFCDKHLSLSTFPDRLFGMPWLPQQLYRDAREFVADGDIDGLRALYAAMVLVDEAEFARLSALDFTFAVNLGP